MVWAGQDLNPALRAACRACCAGYGIPPPVAAPYPPPAAGYAPAPGLCAQAAPARFGSPLYAGPVPCRASCKALQGCLACNPYSLCRCAAQRATPAAMLWQAAPQPERHWGWPLGRPCTTASTKSSMGSTRSGRQGGPRLSIGAFFVLPAQNCKQLCSGAALFVCRAWHLFAQAAAARVWLRQPGHALHR